MSDSLPFITAGLPGTGGSLRVAEEDFIVEEVPAYLPNGSGEHLWLWVEKRGLTTMQAVEALAKAAGLRARDLGTAGMKDKRAITRQWVSLVRKSDDFLATLAVPGLTVLTSTRHANKLRTGHLRGNRFVLTLRGVDDGAEARARAVLARLAEVGLPNAYGPQRFGRDGSTADLGRALLLGGEHPELERAKRDGRLARLALSALQSRLFNRLLARRLEDGSWSRALEGDVLQKPTGASFVCEQPEVDQPRLDRFELSVAGPMVGPKMLAARGAALALEEELLASLGLARADFEKGGELTEGARRPLRVQLEAPRVERTAPDQLQLAFGLPAGSYATCVMAEVMKAGAELPEG